MVMAVVAGLGWGAAVVALSAVKRPPPPAPAATPVSTDVAAELRDRTREPTGLQAQYRDSQLARVRGVALVRRSRRYEGRWHGSLGLPTRSMSMLPKCASRHGGRIQARSPGEARHRERARCGRIPAGRASQPTMQSASPQRHVTAAGAHAWARRSRPVNTARMWLPPAIRRVIDSSSVRCVTM